MLVVNPFIIARTYRSRVNFEKVTRSGKNFLLLVGIKIMWTDEWMDGFLYYIITILAKSAVPFRVNGSWFLFYSELDH